MYFSTSYSFTGGGAACVTKLKTKSCRLLRIHEPVTQARSPVHCRKAEANVVNRHDIMSKRFSILFHDQGGFTFAAASRQCKSQ